MCRQSVSVFRIDRCGARMLDAQVLAGSGAMRHDLKDSLARHCVIA